MNGWPQRVACWLLVGALLLAWAPARAERVALQRLSLGDVGGWIEVVVQVEGRPGRWIIDTGSTRHIVSRSFAERHALVTGAGVRVETAVGAVNGTEVTLPVLHIGTWRQTDQSAVRIDDLGGVLGPAGEGIEGILGLPLLRGNTLDLDLRDWTLAMASSASDTTTPCPEGTEALDLGVFRGLPVITVRVNDAAAESLVLDTGNPAAVVRIAATPSSAAAPGLALAASVSAGALQRTQVPVVRINAPALHRALAPAIQGLAGTALLDGTRWWIDLDRRRACVEPRRVAVPGGFGLTLVQRNAGVVIESVLPGGPAALAGLREGDAVHHWVNGPPSGALRALWARVQGRDAIEVQAGSQAQVVLRRSHFLPALP
ncbi:aspartyl protease family protein [Hydrogenophaga sp.]|uniref:aspartyl protease family protein n=1 Tax=Hydrogenophaga sp. TaxID=1904254 RepID=UPI0027322A46|nr:aspartyl protease family protein [Hydrogenophaga sp.]MDP2015567.1 aspartyl protease family protein [Hydrogenophaga sp.]MDP3167569.1 aspartyl protease family protein [Hydrogenophaga sp.]